MQTHQHSSHTTSDAQSMSDVQSMSHTNMGQPHMDDPGQQPEHMAFLDLVPHTQATHKAIRNGSWFDPNTWEGGQVPEDAAHVLIAQGVEVIYDQESDALITTLRVDGTLQFSSEQDTQLLLDTFAVAPEGTLLIGTEDNPIQADVTTRIIFTSDTPINTDWDPQLLSRGLLSHGQARIYGAEKLDFVALEQDPLAGDNELVLKLDGMSEGLGWQVGDQLVLGGTSFNWRGSNEDNTRFQDEVLTITEINGNRIRFSNNNILSGDNSILRFDHQRPEGLQDQVDLYIANTTRNVIFETENANEVPTQQRGHVMFMHNADVQVNNAGFYNLGRSDKNLLVDDPGQNVDGSVGTGTNSRGRYALHFHRTGADDINGTPALAQGNAVVDSPGWGIVHHDSYAILEDNVVFDVVGAGIVAESGNEIGTWRNNITIKTTGDDNPARDINPLSSRTNRFDFGFNGEGYWVQGASQVSIIDNIAVSAASAGIELLGVDTGTEAVRDVETIDVTILSPDLQNIAQGNADESTVDVAVVPLKQLTGFQSYNSTSGISLWGRVTNGNGQLTVSGQSITAHDYRSVIDDFVLWNIKGNGVFLRYSGNVDLQNGLIHSSQPQGIGVNVNDTSLEQRYINLHIEGFETGIAVPYDADRDFVGSWLRDSTLLNNTQHFGVTPGQVIVEQPDLPSFFQIQENNTFSDLPGNLAPVAIFTSQAIGGRAIGFDASASFDPDSTLTDRASQGIVSYAWDFDGDNVAEGFGRQVSYFFDQVGSHDVTLQIWDQSGAKRSLTQTIEVTETQYVNAFENGDFSLNPAFRLGGRNHSDTAGLGWFAAEGVSWDSMLGQGGGVMLSQDAARRSYIGQSIYDSSIRRGMQTLSLDLSNREGQGTDNEITISLWGINGEFLNYSNADSGPLQAGALPMERQTLVRQTVGGDSFDETTLSWDVDFGTGYQFLVFQINTVGTNDVDDRVVVDNILLTGNGSVGPVPDAAQIGVLPTIFRGLAGDDYAVGGFVKDKFYGDAGNDTLQGLAGDDFLSGGLGLDRLEGGQGNDTVRGHEDNDYLLGAEGDDSLNGGEGNDYLDGGLGNDTLDGSLGNDLLKGFNGNDRLWGGNGNDTLRGGYGDDYLGGSLGDDRLDGEQGNDTLRGHEGADYLWGASGEDSLDGGEGDDTLGGGWHNDTLDGSLGNDVLKGLQGDDRLWGGEGNDTLQGGYGDDYLGGSLGDDRLDGEQGNDTLRGGEGNDYLWGASGEDNLDGGDGDDTLGGGWHNDTLNGSLGQDLLRGQHGDDHLLGGNDNDTLYGGYGNDFLAGSLGNDRLNGEQGNDTLRGHEGNDDLWGASGSDNLEGGEGDDTLGGGWHDDTLKGEEGNDSLTGGMGQDLLIGGAGRDLFSLDAILGSADTILDFSIVDDAIAFQSATLNNLPIGLLSDLQFTLGTAATTAEHRFIYDRPSGDLFYDADGSGGGLQIQVATFQNKARLNADHIQIV